MGSMGSDLDTSDQFGQLQAQIASSYEGLSKRLRVIADFVLRDPSGFALRTSASLAEEIGVAQSAIVRFAQHFGFSGFSEMQELFKTHVQHEAQSYQARIRNLERDRAGKDTEQLIDRFVDAGIASLQEMHRTTPVALIEAAAEIMASCRIVHLLARGRTFPVATYLSYNLARLEVPSNLLDGPGGTLEQQIGLISPQDAVFAVSFQPSSEVTVGAFKHVQSLGAKTIAICDVLRPPFLNADVCFQVSEASVGSFRSLNATISLALILAMRTGTLCAENTK